MKALTVRNPWAECIAQGVKLVENRTRPTKHRGPLAIHAGAAWASLGGIDPRVEAALAGRGRFIYGAVIATVNVVDCHPAADGCCNPWGDHVSDAQVFHWVLDDVHRLGNPVPAKGRLGLWDVDLKAVAA